MILCLDITLRDKFAPVSTDLRIKSSITYPMKEELSKVMPNPFCALDPEIHGHCNG